jgi:hypothetical protein
MGIIGKGLQWLGHQGVDYLAGLVPFQAGGIIVAPVKGKKVRVKKGTKAMKAKMSKLRAMRK